MTEDDLEPRPPHPLVAALYRYRRLIGTAAVLWFSVVIAGGIVLSQLDARNGLHVFGPETWVAGEPAVVRVALREIQFPRFEPLGPVDVAFLTPRQVADLDLDANTRLPDAQTLITHAGPFVQGNVRPPARAGQYKLVLATRTPEALLTATIGITVQATPTPIELPPPRKKRPPSRPDVGPLKLDIGPTSHVLAGGGLPSTLTLRSTDQSGAPVSTAVTLALKEGRSSIALPARVVTNHHGLATLPVEAMHPTFWFELSAGESSAMRRFSYTPTQFALRVPRPVVRPGEPFTVRVDSLHRRGHAFLDLWHGDRWRKSWPLRLDAGHAEATITIPDLGADPTLVWLQAYRTAYLPQKARGGQHVVLTRGDATAAVHWLAQKLEAAGVDTEYARQMKGRADAHPDLGFFLLGRTDRPERDPPLLADSSVTARQTVNALKLKWQRRFVWALVGTGVALFGVLGFLVAYNTRDVQRRWAEAGGADEGEQGTRRRALLDAGYIFLVLAAFLLGMIQILLAIHW